jgi:Carboxypeptidase regulatory-like domain
VKPRVIKDELTRGLVGFGHRDYVGLWTEDIYALAPDKREALRIVLARGYIVTGTVIDVTGRPVPNALVKVAREGNLSDEATMTDANGKFALRGLGKGMTKLYARALDIKQTVQMRIADNGDINDLQVQLKLIRLPADLKKYTVLGMQLADVTPELKSAYDLHFDDGVVILDPGNDSDRLRTQPSGRFAEGCHFWLVGHTRVGSVREFVNQILTEAIGENAAKNAVHGVPVIYKFLTVDEEFAGDGNMTQYLKLTKDDLRQLQIVSEQLTPEPQ